MAAVNEGAQMEDLDDIERKIDELKADETRLHHLWTLTPDENVAGLRALELEMNVLCTDLTDLFRQRQEAWAEHASRARRDTANRLNLSER